MRFTTTAILALTLSILMPVTITAQTLSTSNATAVVGPEKVTIPDSTPVDASLAESISSGSAFVGQRIRFLVVDDVTIDGHVVIRSGAVATGVVTKAVPKKWAGRSGKLEIALQNVTAVDGTKIDLSGTQGGSGASHVGRMVTGIVITSIFTLGGSSLFLLMHGKNITIPEGTQAHLFTIGSASVAAPLAVASVVKQ